MANQPFLNRRNYSSLNFLYVVFTLGYADFHQRVCTYRDGGGLVVIAVEGDW